LTTEVQEGDHQVLLEELRQLLSESAHDTRAREQALVGELAAKPEMPIVLVGAGNLGRRTLALLRSHGRSAAAFTDNNCELWGSRVEGVPVLSPAIASAGYASKGLAIVTIWRGEGGHDFRVTRDDLRRLGWRRVESFIPLYWGLRGEALPYITVDLPTKVLEAREAVMTAASLWSDARSLREFVGQIRWRLTADFHALPPVEPDQYFAEGVVFVGPDEVFVDCGAFNGDTMLSVARLVGCWSRYHAFEPDPATFAALETAVASLPTSLANRVQLYQAAVTDCRSVAPFRASGAASASLSERGEALVDCVALDSTVAEPPPTFIKMDVEGAESAALAGAAQIIHHGRPLLAVAAYHKQSDVWELPRLIHNMAKDHRLFLRSHAGEGFDTVLYAVPPERLAHR
jgi:FkbM family methyltransferase